MRMRLEEYQNELERYRDSLVSLGLLLVFQQLLPAMRFIVVA